MSDSRRMLLPFLLLLSFNSLIDCAPPRLNAFHQSIADLYGVDTNLGRAESIIREEAARIGLSTAYFDTCSEKLSHLLLSDGELDEIEKELDNADLNDARLNHKDEVLKLLATRYPKLYAIIVNRLSLINKYLLRADPTSRKFMQKVGDIILDEIVRYSNTENSSVNFANMVLSLNKESLPIRTMYKDLPQTSKKFLERTFCFNTSLRIFDDKNKFQKLFAKMSHI